MATIEIVGWKKDFGGFTGWDAHARAELRKRLRNGIKASQADIRRLARRLDERQLVCISNVLEEAVYGLTQILQTSGAELRVSVRDPNDQRLFKRVPKR